MPPWTTRWLDWVRDNLLRRRPVPLLVAIGYERAGQTRWETPIPWSADAVVVDLLVPTSSATRRKADFSLRLPTATIPADTLRPELNNRTRITFRMPVPPNITAAELRWKGRLLAPLTLPVLTPQAFLLGLTLTHATVAVRLAGTTVAVGAFVPQACEALLATAVLHSPTALLPLGELGLKVLFTEETTNATFPASVSLPLTQLTQQQAVVMAVCPFTPQQPGSWKVTWQVCDRPLATQRVVAIAAAGFEASVRLLDTRFAVIESCGAARTLKLPTSLTGIQRLGPCFVLQSTEPGAVGVCCLQVTGLANGDMTPLVHSETHVLITDAPTVFLPTLFEAVDVARVGSFELRLNGRLLGIASLRPVPAATVNAEGGFVPPPDFVWSSAAEDELAERLKRLQG
ncbi:MAG: hypothetical protein RMJ56_14855 [Gemmataceae bacterium]|nr:hypothetical protein [Gemmata sp.]MDW8198875.1 hypothetical protein [Gemmataceae bacterium]